MESDLATISASSLGTVGWILAVSIDLHISLSSGGLKHEHFLHWEGLFSLIPCLVVYPVERCRKQLLKMIEAKKLLTTSTFSSTLLSAFQVCSWGGISSFKYSFSGWHTCRSPFILCVPCQLHLQPHLGLPHPAPTEQDSINILFPGYMLPLPVWLLLALKCYSKQIRETLVLSPQEKTIKSLTIPLAFMDL